MPDKQIDTGTDELLASQNGAVLTLTMNRPDARNALTFPMAKALAAQLSSAEVNDSVRCIVLTGASNSFCAGGDIKGLAWSADTKAGSPEAIILRQRQLHHDTAGKLHRMPKPTIAAINGAAAGAGLSLALACDLRVMADSAVMMTSFARVGLSGDFGGTYFLTHLVGPAKAKELYFMSSRLSATDAQALEMTNWVASGDEFAVRVAEIAYKLANGPTIAFGYMKQNIGRAVETSLEECMDMEATHLLDCFQTTDYREAIAAFIGKEEPVFKGR